MQTRKMGVMAFTFMLTIALFFVVGNASAQVKQKPMKMQDCCMMKDGKMMVMKDGKEMPMAKNMTMKNGSKCMTNGQCTMKNGKKMMMKEGECMDMNGKLINHEMHMKTVKTAADRKTQKKEATAMYSCPMHPEETSNKPGKCSKCAMDLVKKN